MSPRRPELWSSKAMCQLAARGEFGRPVPPHPGPLHEPWEHPTSNIQRPTSIDRAIGRHWLFDVGCWLLDVLPLRFRGSKRKYRHLANSLPEEREPRRQPVGWSRALKHVAPRRKFLPLPRGEGWGEGEQSAPQLKGNTSGHRRAKTEPPDRRPASLIAPVSCPAELFGFRISAFLRLSDFGLRISLLDYSPTS